MAGKSMLDWALEYGARGWKIFPLFWVLKDSSCSCRGKNCKRVGKHPIVSNGCLSASSDLKQIREWWTQTPHANIGLATGHAGLVVMDIDDSDVFKESKTNKGVMEFVRKKQGPKNLSELIEIYREKHGEVPETLTVKTGSGGKHFYFLSTHQLPNSQDKIAPDIDLRGQGGYVILPPSNHRGNPTLSAGTLTYPGSKYEWLTGPEGNPADCPPWVEARAMKTVIEVEDSLDENVAKDAKLKDDEPRKIPSHLLVKLLDYIPSDCDRDTWWKVGAALKSELGENGFKAWDEWSKKAPDKYDHKVMQVQWNSFAKEKGISGGTIDFFAKQNGFRGFDIEAADTPEIKGSWVFAVAIKRFVDTAIFSELDKEQFDAKFARNFMRGRPSEHVLKNPNFKIVDSVTYWPEKEIYVNEFGQEKLNYWRPSGVTRARGNVAPFLAHVEYLYPKPEESRLLLAYLAYQVQNPGEKVHWALLLEGEQGNGKSYFASVMRLVLGKHNVKMVHNDQLHETFTQWQRNTQFIVVEEMMAKARLELMNKLKPMITEDWCTIREMYRPPYEQPNRFNFLFFSNHKDSIIIDNTDRRYCVLKTLSPPHPDRNVYYAPLFEWTRQNGPALLDYLMSYDLSDFEPKAHAPMTEGKRALIQQSMLPLDQFIYDHVETKEWPLRWDLVTPSVLVKPLNDFNLRATPKDVSNAFTRLGYLQCGRMKNNGGEDRVNIWAVRNPETYRDMSNDQLRRLWSQQNTMDPEKVGMDVVDALMNERPKNPLTDDKAM